MRRSIPSNVAAGALASCCQPAIVVGNICNLNSDSERHLSEPKESCNQAQEETRQPQAGITAIDFAHCAQIRGLSQAGMEALDLLGIGLAVCESSARMLAANTTARQILMDNDALQLSETGELCTVVKDAPSMTNVIERVIDAGIAGEALLIPRISGRRALTVFVRPAVRERCDRRRQVLVMILDGSRSVETTAPDLHQLFRLTPQETRLANLLMAGKTLPEACDELNIHISTGCTHLRRIFKKTGTHRQGELVSLLLRSIGLVSKSSARKTGSSRHASGAEHLQVEHDDLSFSDLIQVDVDSNL